MMETQFDLQKVFTVTDMALPRSNTSDRELFRNLLDPNEVECAPYARAERARCTSNFPAEGKRGFEGYAFARLFDERESSRHLLGLEQIYRCTSARVDGYINLAGADAAFPILLEIKTTLSWASLGTALAQFISGRHLLMKEGFIEGSNRGLIVFSEFSRDWIRKDSRPLRPWAQLYRHLDELSGTFRISALQITAEGFVNPVLAESGTVRLESLFT